MKPPARPARKIAPVRQLYVPQRANTTWTLDEKRRLLHALRTHATLDPSVLQKHLPSRSYPEIHCTVKAYLVKAQLDAVPEKSAVFKNKEEENLAYWLAKCKKELGNEQDFSRSLSTVLDALALIEDDTPPFSFRQIYAYLSAIIRGMKLIYLQPEDSYIVLQLLTDLTNTAKTRDVFRQVAYLRERLAVAASPQVGLELTSDSPALRPQGTGDDVAKGPAQVASVTGAAAAAGAQAEESSEYQGSLAAPVLEEATASTSTNSTWPSIGGATTSACPRSDTALPTLHAAASHLRTSNRSASKCSSTGKPATLHPPLAARMTPNPFDLDLQRIKGLNPLDIPAFLLHPGCKKPDVCQDMKVRKRKSKA